MSRVLAPLALLSSAAALVLALWVVDLNVWARDDADVTLAAVARDPARYDGRTVTIGGLVARSDYVSPADAEFALVLGDVAGARVLVIPGARARVPHRVSWGTRLRVTGDVRAPHRSPFDRDLSLTGLLSSTRADAAILATAVERVRRTARGGSAAPSVTRTSVRNLVRHPRKLSGGLVAASGRAYRITSRGFVLADAGRSIFVAGHAVDFRAVRSGERIRVHGELRQISRFRAATIRHALDGTLDSRRAPRQARLDRTPSEPGGPFLVLRDIGGT